jgi:hypothetical protein
MAKRTLPGTVKPRKSKRTKKNVEIPTSNIIRGIKQSLREQGFTINGKIKSVKSAKKENKSYVAGPRGPILVNGPMFKKLTEMGYKFKKTSKFITGVMIQPKVISKNNNKGNPIVNAAKQTFSGIFGGTPPEIKKPVNAEASTRNNAGNGGNVNAANKVNGGNVKTSTRNNAGNGGNVKTNTMNNMGNGGNVNAANKVNGGNVKTNTMNNMGNGGNVKTNTMNNMGNGGNVNAVNKVNGVNVNAVNKVNGGNAEVRTNNNTAKGGNVNAANKVNGGIVKTNTNNNTAKGGNVNVANKVNGGIVKTNTNNNAGNEGNGGNSRQTEEKPRNNGNKI